MDGFLWAVRAGPALWQVERYDPRKVRIFGELLMALPFAKHFLYEYYTAKSLIVCALVLSLLFQGVWEEHPAVDSPRDGLIPPHCPVIGLGGTIYLIGGFDDAHIVISPCY